MVLDIQPNAAVQLAEVMLSAGEGRQFTNSVASINIAAGARLEHVRIQSRSPGHTGVARITASLDRDAAFHHNSFDFGGALTRTDLVAGIDGPGADVSMNGLYLASGTQHVDNHTCIAHNVGPAKSREEYRGILAGRSQCVFNGKVIVDNRTTIVVALDREPLREKVSGLDERDEEDLEKIRQELWPEFQSTADSLNALGVDPLLTAEDIWERYTDKRYSPQEPVPVAEDVDVEVEHFFLERAEEYPGVIVERRTVREYPYGSLAAHVLGYVGEINDEELLARGGEVPGSDEVPETTTTIPGQDPKPYEAGDSIGKTGVERAYESDLR